MNPDEASSASAEIRFLGALLVLFAGVEIVTCSIAYLSALAASRGQDADASRTLFWIPQIFFYALYVAGARRLRRHEETGRRMVLGLSWLALVAFVLNTIAAVASSRNPSAAVAMQLWLLTQGDVWAVVFPALAILRLRGPLEATA